MGARAAIMDPEPVVATAVSVNRASLSLLDAVGATDADQQAVLPGVIKDLAAALHDVLAFKAALDPRDETLAAALEAWLS